ncbi:MAG: hypothetical protein ABSG70_15150 [Terriglobales bacterium]|jgi:hypothetical protein
MERRLAEAAKAWRARRTRGETGLRRFFWLVFFEVGLALDLPADDLWAFDVVVLADGFEGEVEDVGGVDCATAN